MKKYTNKPYSVNLLNSKEFISKLKYLSKLSVAFNGGHYPGTLSEESLQKLVQTDGNKIKQLLVLPAALSN